MVSILDQEKLHDLYSYNGTTQCNQGHEVLISSLRRNLNLESYSCLQCSTTLDCLTLGGGYHQMSEVYNTLNATIVVDFPLNTDSEQVGPRTNVDCC